MLYLFSGGFMACIYSLFHRKKTDENEIANTQNKQICLMPVDPHSPTTAKVSKATTHVIHDLPPKASEIHPHKMTQDRSTMSPQKRQSFMHGARSANTSAKNLSKEMRRRPALTVDVRTPIQRAQAALIGVKERANKARNICLRVRDSILNREQAKAFFLKARESANVEEGGDDGEGLGLKPTPEDMGEGEDSKIIDGAENELNLARVEYQQVAKMVELARQGIEKDLILESRVDMLSLLSDLRAMLFQLASVESIIIDTEANLIKAKIAWYQNRITVLEKSFQHDEVISVKKGIQQLKDMLDVKITELGEPIAKAKEAINVLRIRLVLAATLLNPPSNENTEPVETLLAKLPKAIKERKGVIINCNEGVLLIIIEEYKGRPIYRQNRNVPESDQIQHLLNETNMIPGVREDQSIFNQLNQILWTVGEDDVYGHSWLSKDHRGSPIFINQNRKNGSELVVQTKTRQRTLDYFGPEAGAGAMPSGFKMLNAPSSPLSPKDT